MSPLLVPLLAQLIDLKVADRTEARYVKYDSARYEGTTNPKATVSVKARRLVSSLSYGPRFTLVPLDQEPRDLLVFHEAAAKLSYSLRRSTLAFTSAVGYGKINFRFYGIQGPTVGVAPGNGTTPDGSTGMPGTMQPGTSTAQPGTSTPGGTGAPIPGGTGTATTQPLVVDRNLPYYTSVTALMLTHRPLKDVELGAQGGFTSAGGLSSEARFYYPSLRGLSLGVSAADTYHLSKRDSFKSNSSFLQTWSSNGNTSGTLMATETWGHQFGKRTSTSLGAGLNITRFTQRDGLQGYSVFPNFQAALTHQVRLGRGTLALALMAFATPVLDPLRAIVDPRVGAGANVGYALGAFQATVTSNVAFSIAPASRNAGAVDSAQAQALLGYQLAKAVQLDGGLRYTRQAYQGITVVPNTWAAFVGVTLGLDVRLVGSRK